VSILALHSGAFARGQAPFTLGPASEGRPCSHWGLRPRAGPVHTRACAWEQALFTLGPVQGVRPGTDPDHGGACPQGPVLFSVGRAPGGRPCSQSDVHPGTGLDHNGACARRRSHHEGCPSECQNQETKNSNTKIKVTAICLE
jgi:hypothetical protein